MPRTPGQSDQERALVGVVVPMHNAAATVAQALRSLQAQTHAHWRCVVVDDGSTDDGPSIVREFCKVDPRFTLITQGKSGPSKPRNTGIDAALRANCEYLHFLDADDWLTPGALGWLVEAAQETGASYGGYEFSDGRGEPLGRQSPVSVAYAGLDEELEWNRAATHARLLHRDALGDLRFDEHIPYVEDYDLWLRLCVRGVRFKAVERTVAVYRMRPASLSKRFDRMCENYQRVLSAAMERAESAGWGRGSGGRGVVSHERLTRVVGQAALGYATMAALVDDRPEKDRAAELLRGALRPGSFTPAQMAQAVSTAVIFGTCRAPDIDGTSERVWLPPVLDWWRRCADERWLAPGQIDTCLAELARKVAHPDAIADALLETCGLAPGGRVGVVGLNKFGRRLCRRAAGRGLGVLAVDPWSADEELALLEPIPGVRRVRDDAPPPDGPKAWLLPPGLPDAAEAFGRLIGRTPGLTLRRWADMHDSIAAVSLDRLRTAAGGPVRTFAAGR